MNIENKIKNSNPNHPLYEALLKNEKYYQDFIQVFENMKIFLDERELDSFLSEKLQLETNKVNLPQYYQAAIELTVLIHYWKLFPDKFKYEPKLIEKSDKNVECSVKSDSFDFNIEVKCSDFSDWEKSEKKDSIKIVTAGRLPGHKEELNNLAELLKQVPDEHKKDIDIWKNKDNVLKDFLISAHSKFPEGNNSVLNTLFIGLGIPNDIQKWMTYLYEKQGLFTKKPFIDPKQYCKVDCVVFTNLYFRHKNHSLIRNSAWDLNDSFSLVMSSIHRMSEKQDCLLNFSKTLIHYTDELNEYRAPGNVPQEVEWNTRVPWFINDLKEKGIILFD